MKNLFKDPFRILIMLITFSFPVYLEAILFESKLNPLLWGNLTKSIFGIWVFIVFIIACKVITIKEK